MIGEFTLTLRVPIWGRLQLGTRAATRHLTEDGVASSWLPSPPVPGVRQFRKGRWGDVGEHGSIRARGSILCLPMGTCSDDGGAWRSLEIWQWHWLRNSSADHGIQGPKWNISTTCEDRCLALLGAVGWWWLILFDVWKSSMLSNTSHAVAWNLPVQFRDVLVWAARENPLTGSSRKEKVLGVYRSQGVDVLVAVSTCIQAREIRSRPYTNAKNVQWGGRYVLGRGWYALYIYIYVCISYIFIYNIYFYIYIYILIYI